MAEPASHVASEENLSLEPKTTASSTPKEKQPRRRRRRRQGHNYSFASYFPKVLKHVHKGLSLSKEAKGVMDSIVRDVFERIAHEAASLVRYSKHSTLTSRDVQSAVRLLLPGQLHKHADVEGTKALLKFITHP
ncbi:histone H2B type F-M-like [Oryctolagus cuniculus]|uniref:Core Histone H2A/H2B/H3 domain-containing protein n=1 Tax=Oryctolagus cuniculus TaxID=9986 RepID=G1TI54_RABIT|nr:late histone H2B.L4 [Oryctolagus cuniculus]